jgi:hypothetical protein
LFLLLFLSLGITRLVHYENIRIFATMIIALRLTNDNGLQDPTRNPE